jgi:hypothetical protein
MTYTGVTTNEVVYGNDYSALAAPIYLVIILILAVGIYFARHMRKPNRDSTEKEGWGFGHWIAFAGAVYLVPFVVVLLDGPLGTGYLSPMEPWVGNVFDAAYKPLIQLVNHLCP